MGTKNRPGKFDCYAAADPDEPLFVLRGSDKCAALVVGFWCSLKEAMVEQGTSTIDGAKLVEARRCAASMEQWAHSQGEDTDKAKAALKNAIARFVQNERGPTT